MSKLSEIFGPPRLLEGEDPKKYDEFLTRISTCVRPADVLEQILVLDVVDLSWEVIRLRQLRVNVMKANAYKGVSETLAPILGSARHRISPRLGPRANPTPSR